MNEVRPSVMIAELLRRGFYFFVRFVFGALNPGKEFVEGRHIRTICYFLEQAAADKCPRLIICIPPRHLKSIIASVALPAWLLGRDPGKGIICASYAQDLAEDFSLKTRHVMQEPRYKLAFPETAFDPAKKAVNEFRTTVHGFRIATSVGGPLTGKGADILIIDDPMKASDAHSEAARTTVQTWYQETVATRLDDPKNGAIIIIAQRLHHDDLIGHLIAKGGWEVLTMPAIAEKTVQYPFNDEFGWELEAGQCLHPQRIGKPDLERLRKEMGSLAFQAQYLQKPASPEGSIFKLGWLKRYEKPLPFEQYEMIFQSWDTAAEPGENNDYSVCLTFGVLGKKFHLLHVFRQQLLYPDLRHACYDLQNKYQARVVIVERASSGISLYQDISCEGHEWIFNLAPDSGKVSRAHHQSAKVEQGMVYLPQEAEWLAAFESELTAFPSVKHDDQVDALTQFLRALDFHHHPICELSMKKG